jgi:hypothetical protein
MSKRVSPEEVRGWAEEHLRSRPELGLCKAIANVILEPRNPFNQQLRRKPKKDFMILTSLLAAALTAFVIFNFIR